MNMVKNVLRNTYWKNVTSVLTGALIAQAIPVVGAIAIAAIYGPENFGLYSAWLSVVIIITPILSARLEMSLALEKDGKYRQIATYVVLITIVSAGFVLFLFSIAVWYFFIETSWVLAFLVLPTAIFLSISQTWQFWVAANGNFSVLNKLRITQAAIVVIFQISIGFFWSSYISLVISYTVGLLITQLFYFLFLPLEKVRFRKKLRLVVAYWLRHKNFIFYSLPADVVNAMTAQVPILLITSKFGAESAGYYSIAMRVLGTPLAFLGKAILDVFRHEVAKACREKGSCQKEYIYTARVLIVGAIAFSLSVYFLIEIFFDVVFPSEWQGAAVICLLLLPMFSIRFVASPLSYILYVTNNQRIDLLWQISVLVMIVFIFSLGYSQTITLRVYAVSHAFMYFIYLLISYYYSGRNVNVK